MRWIALILLALSISACESSFIPSSGKFDSDQIGSGRDYQNGNSRNPGTTVGKKSLSRGTDQFFNPDALDSSSPETAVIIPVGGKKVEMNLVNASIKSAADAVLGQTLKLPYVVSDEVTGRMTVQTTGPVPKSALYDLFVAGLEVNNARVEKEGNVLRIVPGRAGSKKYRSVQNASLGGSAIVVAPLKYISASQMTTLLHPSIEDGLSVVTDKKRNLLLLSGNSAQLNSAIDAMNLFDVDVLKGKSVALVRLEAADPDAVVEELNLIFETAEGGSLQDVVQFVANPRLKSILVITTRSKYLADAQKWIRELDRTAGGARRYSVIYELQNRSAQELAPILAELMNAQTTETSGEYTEGETELSALGVESAGVQILADDAQNAIVARALKNEHDEIKRLVVQLDTSLRQVMLEATIAEVTLNDDLAYGVGWFFKNGNFSTTFSPNSTGGVGSQFPGFSAVFGTGNTQVALNALASITDVKIISTPTLMVLDNKEAILQIGDQVPIATRSSVDATNPNAPIVSTIEYRDTGVILKVRPRIGNSGRVVLEIEQEVSDVASTTTSGIDSPTIRQRKVQTNIVVNDGSTLALGGIIQESDNATNAKVPGLGDIPLIGAAFRNKSRRSLRTELLILIRPRVVRDGAEARAVTDYWRKKLAGPNKILQTGLGKKVHKLPTQ